MSGIGSLSSTPLRLWLFADLRVDAPCAMVVAAIIATRGNPRKDFGPHVSNTNRRSYLDFLRDVIRARSNRIAQSASDKTRSLPVAHWNSVDSRIFKGRKSNQ